MLCTCTLIPISINVMCSCLYPCMSNIKLNYLIMVMIHVHSPYMFCTCKGSCSCFRPNICFCIAMVHCEYFDRCVTLQKVQVCITHQSPRVVVVDGDGILLAKAQPCITCICACLNPWESPTGPCTFWLWKFNQGVLACSPGSRPAKEHFTFSPYFGFSPTTLDPGGLQSRTSHT